MTKVSNPGDVYGRLTLVCPVKEGASSGKWIVRCACGVEKELPLASLRNGHTKSCGCLRTRISAGDKFGRLEAVAREKPEKNKSLWRVRCSCGVEKVVRANALLTGNTKSCGCLAAEAKTVTARTHGRAGTRAYRIWARMKARTTNPNSTDYAYYMGRGISVCERWLTFENFLADMGDPGPEQTLERVDRDGNYCPENCMWVDRKTQARNTRRNRPVLIDGALYPSVAEAAEATGINYKSIMTAARRGTPMKGGMIISFGGGHE